MKTYLVTGGAGFIGANFVKYILEKHGSDVKVVILDALTYAGNLMTIKAEMELPNVAFFKGDINDTALVNNIFEVFDVDYVVNFAQLTQRAGNFLVAREADPDFSWDKLKGKKVLGGRAGGMHYTM